MFRWLKRTRDEAQSALDSWIGGYELPQFASSTLETLNVIRNESAGLAEVAESLSVDPGLSVRVLRMVNSAGFGLRHSVDDLAHAIQLLGRADLELLLISNAVGGALHDEADSGFDEEAFWRMSAWRAVVARALAARLCPAERCLVFSACLLQEMAVPLLARQRGEPYQALLERARACEAPLFELERQEIETDHAEVAQAMCQAWELPERLAMAIGAHHADPGQVTDVPLPVLLVSRLRERDKVEDVEELASLAESLADVPAEDTASLVEDSAETADALAAMLS